ncbi:flagellar motor protein MotB [Photobacterium sanguinicancri]|uniref:flagellar motor protein MotB n=1 Tax=Photobacterium sanguinicancri TaxID=875932 RepID=UPI002480C299|nr:flagellar motor protein MotB [Photobacterium sanguinicancri]
MSKEPHIIIVKKKRRGHHDEHHGGAWKVAFADFAIAMMAFFMVLWIMEIASKEEREEIQYRLQHSSVFDNMENVFDVANSPFPIDFGGEASPFENPVQSNLSGNNKLDSSLHQQIPEGKVGANAGRGSKLNSMIAGKHLSTAQLMMLANELKSVTDALSASENVVLEIVPQGLRILIQDSTKHFMFERGSSNMTPFFEDMLYSLAPILGQIKNRMVISGHTDVTRFHRDTYSNWELSGERALKARQTLVSSGLPQGNVLQVAAMAERMLVNENDPKSGKNRRIEMMILTKEADTQLALLFGQGPAVTDSPALQQARNFAESNQPVSRLEVMLN